MSFRRIEIRDLSHLGFLGSVWCWLEKQIDNERANVKTHFWFELGEQFSKEAYECDCVSPFEYNH
jgi:hypothetical protein